MERNNEQSAHPAGNAAPASGTRWYPLGSNETRNLVALAALILTLVAAVFGGIYWVGSLESRVSGLDRRFDASETAIESAKDNAIREVKAKAVTAKKSLTDTAAAAQTTVETARLPVGTVVASVLAPATFKKLAGEDWELCDGQNIIDSPLSKEMKTEALPDLRGMFLRGMNAGRSDEYHDPDKDRAVGSVQEQSLKSHSHGVSIDTKKAHSDGGTPYYTPQNADDAGDVTSSEEGGVETRPNNVAVYFYIRVR